MDRFKRYIDIANIYNTYTYACIYIYTYISQTYTYTNVKNYDLVLGNFTSPCSIRIGKSLESKI